MDFPSSPQSLGNSLHCQSRVSISHKACYLELQVSLSPDLSCLEPQHEMVGEQDDACQLQKLDHQKWLLGRWPNLKRVWFICLCI